MMGALWWLVFSGIFAFWRESLTPRITVKVPSAGPAKFSLGAYDFLAIFIYGGGLFLAFKIAERAL
jgi:hypothetical protein